MRNYIINRAGNKREELGEVTVKVTGGKFRETKLNPGRSQKIWNHSPDGFEFGYGGSGPAQLALAILLDFTGDKDLSVHLHQDFKWDYIYHIKHPGTTIEGETIEKWINERKK